MIPTLFEQFRNMAGLTLYVRQWAVQPIEPTEQESLFEALGQQDIRDTAETAPQNTLGSPVQYLPNRPTGNTLSQVSDVLHEFLLLLYCVLALGGMVGSGGTIRKPMRNCLLRVKPMPMQNLGGCFQILRVGSL